MKSFKRSSEEKLQATLVLASGEANILPLQQGIKLQLKLFSWAYLGHFICDTWFTVCFTGLVRFKSSLCLWGLAESGRPLVRFSAFVNVDKLGYYSDQLKCNLRNLSFWSVNKTLFKVFINLQWDGSDFKILWIALIVEEKATYMWILASPSWLNSASSSWLNFGRRSYLSSCLASW